MTRLAMLLAAAAIVTGATAIAQDSSQGRLPVGYARTARPDPPGSATRVEVRLFVVDVAQIEAASQTFTADVFFNVTWHDPRLATGDDGPERIYGLDEVWWPDLVLTNRRAVEIVLPDVVRVDPQGTVRFTQRVIATFSALFDLRDLPYDRQILPIQMASHRYSPEEVSLVKVSSRRSGRSFSASGWELELSENEADLEQVAVVAADRAHLNFVIAAERSPIYIRLMVFLPLVLIVLMAWSVFWIDPTYLPSQIGMSTASVFTMIAFRLSLGLLLPEVSYMTRADLLVLAGTVLVFLALGEVVVAGWMVTNGKEAMARRMDRWARWIYLIAGVVLWLAIVGPRF